MALQGHATEQRITAWDREQRAQEHSSRSSRPSLWPLYCTIKPNILSKDTEDSRRNVFRKKKNMFCWLWFSGLCRKAVRSVLLAGGDFLLSCEKRRKERHAESSSDVKWQRFCPTFTPRLLTIPVALRKSSLTAHTQALHWKHLLLDEPPVFIIILRLFIFPCYSLIEQLVEWNALHYKTVSRDK